MIKPVSKMAFAATVLSAFLGSTALAQTEQPAQSADEAPVANSGDIIVTAQRRAQTLERTPVSIAVIGAEALSRQMIVSEQDLQIATPGLTVRAGQSSNALNYSLRGQTVDAYTSSRPSVLPYFNEVQVGAVGASSFYDLESVQVLKGPQGTLFGRNSTGGAVLFTSTRPTNEFGGYVTVRAGNYSHFQAEGAINVPLVDNSVLLRVAGFIQRRNGFQFNLFNNERVGDIKRENIRASLTLRPSEAIENQFVIAYAHTGGGSMTGVLRDVQSLADNALGKSFVPATILYGPTLDAAVAFPGAWAAYLAAHPKANPLGLLGEGAAQNARSPFLVDQDGLNYVRSKSLTISNITTFDIGEDTQIKNVLGYVWQRSLEAGEYDGSNLGIDSNGIAGQNGTDTGRGGTLKQFSEELQLNGKAFNQALTYVVGGYFSDERDHSRSLSKIVCLEPIIPCTDQYNSGLRTNKTIAGYAQGTYAIGESGLSITAGARYSSEKITFEHTRDDFFLVNFRPEYVRGAQKRTFNNFSYQLGVEYQADSGMLLYAKTRRSYRSGGFNFYAPPLTGLGNNAGNEYLSERATDYEVGLKYRGDLGNVPTRVNLAVYTMTIDDIQRANYVSINGSLAGLTVNVPKSKVSGFELDGSINPTTWLSFGGSLNYTKARFTDGLVQVFGNPAVVFGPYPDTPKWSGSIYADITVPVTERMEVQLRGDVYKQTKSYFGSTNNTINPNTELPGYTIANLRLGLEDKQSGWSLAGVVKNVTDKTYYVGGLAFYSLFSLNTVVPGEPRTFLIEAKLKF